MPSSRRRAELLTPLPHGLHLRQPRAAELQRQDRPRVGQPQDRGRRRHVPAPRRRQLRRLLRGGGAAHDCARSERQRQHDKDGVRRRPSTNSGRRMARSFAAMPGCTNSRLGEVGRPGTLGTFSMGCEDAPCGELMTQPVRCARSAARSLPLPRPDAAPRRHTRQVRLDVQDRRAVQHVHTATWSRAPSRRNSGRPSDRSGSVGAVTRREYAVRLAVSVGRPRGRSVSRSKTQITNRCENPSTSGTRGRCPARIAGACMMACPSLRFNRVRVRPCGNITI
jgi:hypothetical protein